MLHLATGGGGALSSKLTDAQLPAFLERIPVLELPATFRDAITAARTLPKELAAKYIWIDALCIVQDQMSKANWTIEAPKMGDIYKYSLLTFSAAFGMNSHAGLFHWRNFLSLCPLNVQPAWDANNQMYQCYYSRPEDTMLKESDISTRGWVVQERFFSARILSFTSMQLFWECCKEDWSETIGQDMEGIVKQSYG